MRPSEVTVFIEIVPSDTVKYEADKETGYLKIDRPQQYSNVVPANYGFIPQTYCGERMAAARPRKSGRRSKSATATATRSIFWCFPNIIFRAAILS